MFKKLGSNQHVGGQIINRQSGTDRDMILNNFDLFKIGWANAHPAHPAHPAPIQ